MEYQEIIKEHYTNNVQVEWERIDNRPEFLLTCRFLDRLIRPGDSVLDIGGGPGRYSLRLARQGCDVTLLDLTPANVEFAQAKAKEAGISLNAICGDAREADKLAGRTYDHVLLMGPLYHLLKEEEREKAVAAALGCLKPGGLLYASFISLYAGLIYAMVLAPEILLDTAPSELAFYECLRTDKSFAGEAFTQAHFIRPKDILPFMSTFPLEKLHLFSQEGILSPNEKNIFSQPPEVISAWLDMAEALCEREELHSWAEHLMYIGRKKEAQ